jgi:hypothetical protein
MKRLAATLVGIFVAVPGAWAELVPMTPGQYMGSRAIGAIGDLAAVIGQQATANEELENEIVNSRREFFASPEGPERVAAAKRFDSALFKRDLHFVAERIVSDPGAGAILNLVFKASGTDRVDGGVPPYCHYEFTQWADELESYLKPGKPLEDSLKQAEPTYNTYRVVRDLAEFLFANPNSALRAENPRPQDYLAAWMLGAKYVNSVPAANTEAAKIAKQVGPKRLAEIVAVLRDWTAVTYKLDGAGVSNPGLVLNSLVSGEPGEPGTADWSPRRLAFSEIRGRVLPAPYRLGPVIDELQALWESGRKNHDAGTLRAAVQKRDELLRRIAEVNSMRPGPDYKLVFDLAVVRLGFFDYALQTRELDAMRAGERNPNSAEVARETREYLVVNSKLQPRSLTAQQKKMAGPSQASASAPARGGATPQARPESSLQPASTAQAGGSGPVLPDLNDEGVGPFDRAIILAQQPKAALATASHLSNLLSSLGRKWGDQMRGMQTNQAKGTRSEYLAYSLGNIVRDTKRVSDQLQRQIDIRKGQMPGVGADVRRDMEERNAAQGAVIDELKARIPELEKVIAELPAK